METFTRYSQSKFQVPLLGLLLFLFASAQTSFGQIYANAQSNRAGTFDCLISDNIGCADSDVTSPGNARDGSASDVSKAVMFSEVVLGGLGGAGKAYLTLRFTNDVPAQETVYVKIDQPTSTGILSSVLGFIGLEGTRIKGQLKSGATNTSDGSNVSTASTKIITDVAGNYFLAITPGISNATNFNAVRIEVAAPFDVASSITLNVYNAFYNDGTVTPDCTLPQYTSLGEQTGLSVSLFDAVKDPRYAIDGNMATASELGSSLANVGLFTTLSQTMIFKQPSAATDQAVVYLSTGASVLDVNLFSELKIQAFNGANVAGTSTALSSLISLNLLGYPSGIPANTIVPFYYTPTGAFDRVVITLGSAVNVALFNGGIFIHEVGQVTRKPTISSKFVYQFTGATPNVTATSTSNNIFWQGPLPSRTNLNATSLPSAAAFPTAVNSNGDYVAVSVKASSCQSVLSDSTKLKVIVLTDASVAIPAGVASQPLASGGAIKAESPDHTFTYGNVTVSPVGLSVVVNPNTGAVSVASLPAVAVTTEYDVTVEIFENGVSTGLFLTKKLTVYPAIVLPAGTFPATDKTSTSYSRDISTLITGGATGGKGPGYYMYYLTPQNTSGRVAATTPPPGFTLSTAGILEGNPSLANPDVYAFPIYVNDGVQETTAGFSLTITSNPLPVKLTSFKARKEGSVAQISWSTTEESNSDRFELERSTKGKAWEVIGSKTALGESVALRNYSLTDAQPLNGENLYRLKMIDRDGTFALSKIESITFSTDGVSVFPNPLTNADNMQVSVDNWNNVKSVRVVNSLGKIVFETTNALHTGIKASNLTSGLYLVQIVRTDGTVSAYKIVKQ